MLTLAPHAKEGSYRRATCNSQCHNKMAACNSAFFITERVRPNNGGEENPCARTLMGRALRACRALCAPSGNVSGEEGIGRPGRRADFGFTKRAPKPRERSKDTGDYYPPGIGPICERARITTPFMWPQYSATLDTLATSTSAQDQLTLLGSLFPDLNRAWRSYFAILEHTDHAGQTGRDRFPVTTYARVQSRSEATEASRHIKDLGDERPPSDLEVGRPFFEPDTIRDDIAIQYWFCYYFDDWANCHEGDWEGICLFLRGKDEGYQPLGAAYYTHENGMRRRWADVERSIAGGDHPLVYVAAGSHASYFQYSGNGYVVTVPGKIIPWLRVRLQSHLSLSSTVTDQVPDGQRHKPITPRVEVLPDPVGPPNPNSPAWLNKKWLSFPGAWGIRFVGFGYGGPIGPSHKGLKWQNPFTWMERRCRPDVLVY